jgi:NifU-like protein involved in Fe-S cluster formation
MALDFRDTRLGCSSMTAASLLQLGQVVKRSTQEASDVARKAKAMAETLPGMIPPVTKVVFHVIRKAAERGVSFQGPAFSGFRFIA